MEEWSLGLRFAYNYVYDIPFHRTVVADCVMYSDRAGNKTYTAFFLANFGSAITIGSYYRYVCTAKPL